MKISVVTISFNQAQFLESAIRSVVGERSRGVDIEYIVVDPGSSDGSRDIIERYRDEIQHIVYEPDAGPADGLNRGLSRATGEIFCYVNADDMLMPGALAEATTAFTVDPSADVIYANGRVIDEAGAIGRRLIASPRVTAKRYARGLVMIVQQAAFIRTATLRAVGGFNVANRTSWDAEAFLRIAARGGRFKRVWRDWGLFRIYAGSISGSGRLIDQYRDDCDRLFSEFFGRVPNRGDRLLTPTFRAILQFRDPRGLAAKAADRLRVP